MKASKEITEWIRKFEGLKLCAYKCPAGVWTIGYGHTGGVRQDQCITPATAERLLAADIAEVENQVAAAVGNAKLTQGQFDALVSFTFNLGIGKLQGSTLLRKVKANSADPTIADEFGRWVYSAGVKLDGLVKRRKVEARFWSEGK